MLYYVYIIYSPSFDQFYKGQTEDIFLRVKRHNDGIENATSRYRPWTLVWYTAKPNRSDAMALEKKLKNLSRERLIQFILKYQGGIAGADELLLIKQLSAC